MKNFVWLLLLSMFLLSALMAGCSLNPGSMEVEAVESVEERMGEYLTTKGYTENDYDLTVEYHLGGEKKMSGPFVIHVMFHDESDVRYSYTYKDKSPNKEIYQSGVEPLIGKVDKNFKHAE